ncbi:MAG: WGR domain-containing protein, partial [Planctomycetota bacterium]|nr:WGR domain-containing protein [Planctomycetota bacterium]
HKTTQTTVKKKKVAVQIGKRGIRNYPESSSPSEFQCFGPPVTKDGEFNHARICDLGCFTQDGKDSNKYYHGAVVQHMASDNWYAYFEWGRTGAVSPNFQFIGCRDEAHAVAEFTKQMHSKNDKRGEWVTLAGIRTLRAKKGKDCYLVRPQATRSTGLPDARSIKINEGAKAEKIVKKPKSGRKKKINKADPQTTALMRDLTRATVAYTRGAMADDSLPTQVAIDEGRQILLEAQKRVGKVGENLNKQLRDKELRQLSSLMFSRIPKRKPVGASDSTWILSSDNIFSWQNDLDAFESALYATDIDQEQEHDFDPFEGMNLHMEWISPKSETGKYLYQWWPKASNNRHGYLGTMKIKNLWRVERFDDKGKIAKSQEQIIKETPKIKHRPLFQKPRKDLSSAEQSRYQKSNTALLFHGTRSVNVSGILREALRLPKQLVGVVITGAMFGPGIYFADDWKKSAGYTSLQSSYYAGGNGSVKGRSAFMFACDVVLGAPYVAPSWGGYTGPPKGYQSIYGKSGASGVQNNEFIVFKAQQNQIRYLCEFSI